LTKIRWSAEKCGLHEVVEEYIVKYLSSSGTVAKDFLNRGTTLPPKQGLKIDGAEICKFTTYTIDGMSTNKCEFPT